MEINTNNMVVNINMVQPNDYNPKVDYKEDEENAKEFEKIKESIKIAGQIQPVIVRELDDGKYEIINGYHRWSAMKELGSEEIEIKNLGKIDFDIAISRALLTEDTKVPVDAIELANLMKELVTDEKPIEYWQELLPYTGEVIKSKIDLLDFDFTQYDEESEGVSLKNLTYSFKFEDEEELTKIKDYFSQFEKDERGKELLSLINLTKTE
jgi:uncharacterized ParB-like nuclease family protein